MSTNKTQNLNLHSWEQSDPVKMSEFNENFAALDENAGETWAQVETLQSAKADISALNTVAAALSAETAAREALAATVPEIVFGTYTGNGAAVRTISLGRAPRIVLVEATSGIRNVSAGAYGALAAQGYPAKNGNYMALALTELGFTVACSKSSTSYMSCTNMEEITYYYLAIF